MTKFERKGFEGANFFLHFLCGKVFFLNPTVSSPSKQGRRSDLKSEHKTLLKDVIKVFQSWLIRLLLLRMASIRRKLFKRATPGKPSLPAKKFYPQNFMPGGGQEEVRGYLAKKILFFAKPRVHYTGSLISKGMSLDFDLENGIAMSAVEGKCGEFEVSAADLTIGEEFGFFLYSKTSRNGKPIKDIGCESSLDSSTFCPVHSAPKEPTIGGPFSMFSCTKKISQGNLSFYNRIYDGSTLSYTWGSCSNTCGLSEPVACSFSSTTEEEEVQLTFDLIFSGPSLSASYFGAAELESVASSTAELVGVDASMVKVGSHRSLFYCYCRWSKTW